MKLKTCTLTSTHQTKKNTDPLTAGAPRTLRESMKSRSRRLLLDRGARGIGDFAAGGGGDGELSGVASCASEDRVDGVLCGVLHEAASSDRAQSRERRRRSDSCKRIK